MYTYGLSPCPIFICAHPCHLWLKQLFGFDLTTPFISNGHEQRESLNEEPSTKNQERFCPTPCPVFICTHPCHLWLKQLFDFDLTTPFISNGHEQRESLERRTKHQEPSTPLLFILSPTCLSNFSKVRPPAGPPEAFSLLTIRLNTPIPRTKSSCHFYEKCDSSFSY